nr:immunoglobulin heavy chain junction region [Mus musculus]
CARGLRGYFDVW